MNKSQFRVVFIMLVETIVYNISSS